MRFHEGECNDWLLVAGDGASYAPRTLPEEYAVEGARATARIRPVEGLLGSCPGTIVDVLAIAPAPCAHTCGAFPPPIRLRVVHAATSAAVEGVTVSFLAAPAWTPGAPPTGAAWGAALDVTLCSVGGPGAGRYELEIGAPGYAAARVVVEVPAVPAAPGACCHLPYLEQTVDVRLERAP